MIMRWHIALMGLAVTLVLGMGFNHYMIKNVADLGHLTHVDTSLYQENDKALQAFDGYVDFDNSMQLDHYADLCESKGFNDLLNYFRAMYQHASFFKVMPTDDVKIPQVFHYIWLGKKLPAEYLPYLRSWHQQHPSWKFVYWVDNVENYDLAQHVFEGNFDDLETILKQAPSESQHIVVDVKNLKFPNRVFFDETTNYGERSDILKWEVVYRLGGVYIDVDMECLKPLDMLHSMYDFYTGLQPLDTNLVQLGAALFAAKPGHPILKHCVETIKNDRHKQQIVIKTGPIHFTKSFISEAGGHPTVDVALPATYFYPCSYEQKGMPRRVWMRPESFAVHHWEGSWLKPEAFEQL